MDADRHYAGSALRAQERHFPIGRRRRNPGTTHTFRRYGSRSTARSSAEVRVWPRRTGPRPAYTGFCRLPRRTAPNAGMPTERTGARPAGGLPGISRYSGRVIFQTRRVGLRLDRNSTRHYLGLLYATGVDLGQTAGRRHARRPAPDPDRGLLGPRQLGGISQFSCRYLGRRGTARLSTVIRQLPPLLPARR